MKPDAGMNNTTDEQNIELHQNQHHPPSQIPPPTHPPHHQQTQPRENLSLVERLNTISYGQAREIIVKEMRANEEAITRLEARIETLVTILRQAGVELPPFPTFPSVKD